MCKYGDTIIVSVPTRVGITTESRGRASVDRCIAPIVAALNAGGVPTVASCCGHGKGPGNIALADGRELLIVPHYEAARNAEEVLADRTRWQP